MTDRLTGMAVFAKAVELGSFTAAGKALGMSSQMVGKHVGQLEHRLGTELLRRTTRRQSLTAIGETFYERCRTILAETEAAEALARDHGSTPRGHLRINAPVIFGATALAPVVLAYMRRYPQVEVELALEDRYVDLVAEGYDVAVRLGPLRDSTLRSRALSPHRLIVCAAPAYIAAHGTPAAPDDLERHACLSFIYSTGRPYSEWSFERQGRSYVVETGGRFRCNDARVLLDAALAGDGVVLLSERVVARHLAEGRLVRLLEDYTAPVRPIICCFPAADIRARRYEPSSIRSCRNSPSDADAQTAVSAAWEWRSTSAERSFSIARLSI